MARAHFADVLIGTSGTGALSLLDGATVHVYDQGTTNHIAQTLYAADSGGTTIANPLTSDANGKVEFWLDTPARVDLSASKTGFNSSTRTVDVEAAPSGGGSGLILTHDVQLNDAAIKGLPVGTVDLVPAPGVGLCVQPLWIALHADFSDGVYTNVGAGTIALLQSSVEQNQWTLPALFTADIESLTRDALLSCVGHNQASNALVVSSPGVDNQPCQCAIFNTPDGGVDLGAFTGGGSGNTLSIRTYYSLVPTVPFGA